jgi:thiaminase
MRHLKTFESYGKLDSDIHEDIAKDILPKLQKLKNEKGSFTIQDYMKYMEERGADPMMVDCVASYIVNMGFDFDFEKSDDDDIEFELKNTFY